MDRLQRGAPVRREHVADLIAVLRKAAEAAAGRAESAACNRRSHADALRAGIRKAAGALSGLPGQPLAARAKMVRGRIETAHRADGTRGPACYSLPKVPSVRLIAEVLREMDREHVVCASLMSFRNRNGRDPVLRCRT